jgi:hypothetical protein
VSFIHRSGPGPRVSAALAAAVLLLAVLAGSAAAAEGPGALRDPFVGPRTGTPATVVRFSVTFLGNGAPSSAQVDVVIDGVARHMAPSLVAPTFGVRYRFSTSLPIGTHTIAFSGADASTTATLPAGVVTILDPSEPDPSAGGGGGGVSPGGTGGSVGADTPTGGVPGGGGSQPPPPGGATQPPAPTATPEPPAPMAPPAPKGAPAAPGPATPAPTLAPVSAGGSHDGTGASAGSATGGAQATRNDASGAADHSTSGSGGGPASGGSPAGAPPAAASGEGSAVSIAVPSAPSTPDGLALGQTGAPADGSAGSGGVGGPGGSGGSGGHLDDRTLSVLTGRGDIPPTTRMLIAAISTTTTTTAVAAFFMFGRRRRDGDPPAPDEVLAANAGRLVTTPASALVPPGDPGSGVRLADEAGIPRWRRPSLLEARKADPRYADTSVHGRQSFNHGGDPATAGTERRRIRYRAVSLLDAPDPLRSAEIGDLDEGDEVQLLERSGGYWLVRCPDGNQGWVHRMTLGDVVSYEGGSDAFNSARRSFAPRGADTSPADEAGEATEYREVDRSIGEDGADLLSTYLKRRHG